MVPRSSPKRHLRFLLKEFPPLLARCRPSVEEAKASGPKAHRPPTMVETELAAAAATTAAAAATTLAVDGDETGDEEGDPFGQHYIRKAAWGF